MCTSNKKGRYNPFNIYDVIEASDFKGIFYILKTEMTKLSDYKETKKNKNNYLSRFIIRHYNIQYGEALVNAINDIKTIIYHQKHCNE